MKFLILILLALTLSHSFALANKGEDMFSDMDYGFYNSLPAAPPSGQRADVFYTPPNLILRQDMFAKQQQQPQVVVDDMFGIRTKPVPSSPLFHWPAPEIAQQPPAQ